MKRKKHIQKRETKKVVLFIVEGLSDQDALEKGFTELYHEQDPEIQVMFCRINDENHDNGGDITSAFGIEPKNLKKYIDRLCVEGFLKDNGLYPKDLKEIIQITDTDGTYIPDEMVIFDPSLKEDETVYLEDRILTGNLEHILDRNHRKRENMDALFEFESIKIGSKTIPYSVYFFSRNIDMFTGGYMEGGETTKRDQAKYFAALHPTADSFYNAIVDDRSSLHYSYFQSWNFIREDTNSLKKYTNIDILLAKIRGIELEERNEMQELLEKLLAERGMKLSA